MSTPIPETTIDFPKRERQRAPSPARTERTTPGTPAACLRRDRFCHRTLRPASRTRRPALSGLWTRALCLRRDRFCPRTLHPTPDASSAPGCRIRPCQVRGPACEIYKEHIGYRMILWKSIRDAIQYTLCALQKKTIPFKTITGTGSPSSFHLPISPSPHPWSPLALDARSSTMGRHLLAPHVQKEHKMDRQLILPEGANVANVVIAPAVPIGASSTSLARPAATPSWDACPATTSSRRRARRW
jgi:hypothetical protein